MDNENTYLHSMKRVLSMLNGDCKLICVDNHHKNIENYTHFIIMHKNTRYKISDYKIVKNYLYKYHENKYKKEFIIPISEKNKNKSLSEKRALEIKFKL